MEDYWAKKWRMDEWHLLAEISNRRSFNCATRDKTASGSVQDDSSFVKCVLDTGL
jgi:hypothetical protein